MDINHFMKIQNAYGTKNRREKELAKINNEMSKHFEDTYDTVDILLNGIPTQLMIIKDTDNNTFKKKIKSVHGDKFNLGDYVKWNNQTWLITLVDVDERTWNRGYMYLCTVPLRWQNSEGKIIERYVYADDFTKYSNGVTGNYTVTIGDNQYGLTVPIDEETKKLKRDMRFVIDLDDMDEPDVYKLTNRKTKLNDNQYMGRGGTMILTMSLNAFDNSVDKQVVLNNGEKVWICNYRDCLSSLTPSPSDETTILSKLEIKCPNLEIKPTGYPKKITAALYEVDTGLEVKTANYEWIVDTKISDYISYTADNDILKISLSKQYDECDDEIIITCTDTKTKQSNSIILTTKGVF